MHRFFYLSPLILQTCIWPVVRPVLWFFLRLDVHGLEHLRRVPSKYDRTYTVKKGGVIFAANHSSELDPILIPASLPFLSRFMPMFYTSRETDFYRKSGWRQRIYGGLLFKLWGAHPIRAGLHDYAASLHTHIGFLRDGKSVIMFPDGKRLPEREIGSVARGGLGYLAWRTGAAVVPVRIENVFRIRLVEFLLRRRHVRIVFGKPSNFPPQELSPSPDACRAFSKTVLASVRALGEGDSGSSVPALRC